MEKHKNSKRGIVLIIALAMILLGCFGAWIVKNDGGAIKTESVKFVTSDGVILSGTLYKPNAATADNKAPGILVNPGGSTPDEFYSTYSLELARRGFVVFSYEYYGCAGSELSPAKDSGSIAAMDYLTSLAFVDTDNLGSIGHSMGGGLATNAINAPSAQNAKNRFVMYLCCGGMWSRSDEPYEFNGSIAIVWPKFDQTGTGMSWDTLHEDNLVLPKNTKTLFGLDENTGVIEVGKWYGDCKSNQGRILFTPPTTHAFANLTTDTVNDVVYVAQSCLEGSNSVSGTTYVWMLLFLIIAAVGLCILIFPVGSILLDTPFFKSLNQPVPKASSKLNWQFFAFLFVPGILMTLLISWAVFNGQAFFAKISTKVFKAQTANGLLMWFILCAIIILVITVLRALLDKNVNKSLLKDQCKTSFVNLLKAALFGLLVIAIIYLAVAIGKLFFNVEPMIFQTYLFTSQADRLVVFPVYYVLFGLCFSIVTYSQTIGLRLENKPKSFYWLTLVSNALPAVLLVGYVLCSTIFGRHTPIDGAQMSRAFGAMCGMLFLYIVISKITTYFYKKTGNIYVSAMLNSAFMVWLSINVNYVLS